MLAMAHAFVIAATTDAETPGDPPRALWVVLADTPHLAVEAARASGCKVGRIVGTLSEWSGSVSSPISQDETNILAHSFDPLNGASL
jgi:hypothetical protein